MSEPPYYILLAHSSLQHGSSGQSNALVHADIEYRYADDSPLSLLPRFPDEHVLVFSYDPASATKPTINSTSSQLALSGVKVLPAPGAHIDEDVSKNDNMYILEVTSTSDDQYARRTTMLEFLLNRSRIGLPVVWNHPKPTYRILGLSSLDSNKGTLSFVAYLITRTFMQEITSPNQIPSQILLSRSEMKSWTWKATSTVVQISYVGIL